MNNQKDKPLIDCRKMPENFWRIPLRVLSRRNYLTYEEYERDLANGIEEPETNEPDYRKDYLDWINPSSLFDTFR